MEVHLYIHSDLDNSKLDKILQMLQTLQREVVQMAASVDDVIIAVQNETTVEQSVITLLGQLSAQIKAAGTDPVKLQQVLDQINANTTALSAAVTANTPVPPTPTV